jgi:hypothetical protein
LLQQSTKTNIRCSSSKKQKKKNNARTKTSGRSSVPLLPAAFIETVRSPEQAIATLATKTEANTVLEEEKTANFRIHHLTACSFGWWLMAGAGLF